MSPATTIHTDPAEQTQRLVGLLERVRAQLDQLETGDVDESIFQCTMMELPDEVRGFADAFASHLNECKGIRAHLDSPAKRRKFFLGLETDEAEESRTRECIVQTRERVRETEEVVDSLFKIASTRTALEDVTNETARKCVAQALTKTTVYVGKVSQGLEELSRILILFETSGLSAKVGAAQMAGRAGRAAPKPTPRPKTGRGTGLKRDATIGTSQPNERGKGLKRELDETSGDVTLPDEAPAAGVGLRSTAQSAQPAEQVEEAPPTLDTVEPEIEDTITAVAAQSDPLDSGDPVSTESTPPETEANSPSFSEASLNDAEEAPQAASNGAAIDSLLEEDDEDAPQAASNGAAIDSLLEEDDEDALGAAIDVESLTRPTTIVAPVTNNQPPAVARETGSVTARDFRRFQAALNRWARWHPLVSSHLGSLVGVVEAAEETAVDVKLDAWWSEREETATGGGSSDGAGTARPRTTLREVDYAGELPLFLFGTVSGEQLHAETHSDPQDESSLIAACEGEVAEWTRTERVEEAVAGFYSSPATRKDTDGESVTCDHLCSSRIEIQKIPVLYMKCGFKDPSHPRAACRFEAWLYGNEQRLRFRGIPKQWNWKATVWAAGFALVGLPLGYLLAKVL